MKPLIYVLPLLALLLTNSVNAQDNTLNYNQISLDASASSEVKNDTMMVTLYAQEEGSNAALLSDKVNKKINTALAELKRHKAIKVETESYSTTPVYNKSQVIAWQVKQSIRLESKDMALMSDVLGKLQQDLKLGSIAFDVSREKAESETQSLIDQALAAYAKRATQVSKQLDASSYKIVNMNVSTTTGSQPYRYKRANVMMADAAPVTSPEVAQGEKTLTVRVSGTIELEK